MIYYEVGQKMKSFKIEGSNDNQNFTLLHEDAKADGFTSDHSVVLGEKVSYRYVKLTVKEVIGAYQNVTIREFQIYISPLNWSHFSRPTCTFFTIC